MGSRVKQK